MTTCTRYADAIDDGIVGGDNELEAELTAHLNTCETCATDAREWAELATLTATARAEFQALPDLAPSSWVAIRAGIDAETGRRPWLSWRLALGGLVAGGAVAALAMMVFGPQVEATRPEGEPRVAPRTAEAPTPTPAPQRVAANPTPQPAPPVAHASGDVLRAGDTALRVVAFDRHTLTLAPGCEIQLTAWEQGRVVVALRAGTLTSDVRRQDPTEIFEVVTEAARVQVLGTTFSVTVGADGVTDVSVAHGVVGVTGADDTLRRVGEGESLRVGGPATPAAAVAPADAAEPAADPAPEPRAAKRKRGKRAKAARSASSRAKAAADAESDELKVIEINVPDQAAPDVGGGTE